MALAAFLFNWQVLPRIGGQGDVARGRARPRLPARHPALPARRCSALMLVFRDRLWMAAAVWGILAFGDGMASLVGQARGRPAAALERRARAGRASWRSSLFGAARRGGADRPGRCGCRSAPGRRRWILGLVLPVAAFCALVESLPTTLDDNLTVPLAGAVAAAAAARTRRPRRSSASPTCARRLAIGLGVNGAVRARSRTGSARSTCRARSRRSSSAPRSRSGSAWRGLVVMIAFFVLGTAATKLGYRMKAARGIAQEKGGARGWRNAWANGGVPAFLALHGRRSTRAARDRATRRLRGGGRHRRRRHLLVRGRQGLRPAHVPDHDASGRFRPAPKAPSAWRGRSAASSAARSSRPSVRLAGLYGWRVAALVALAGLLGQPGRERHRHGGREARLARQRPAERAQHRHRRGSRRRARAVHDPLMSSAVTALPPARPGRLKVYLDFARPFTLLPPALGVLSGAVTAWGAGHQKPAITWALLLPVALRHADGRRAQRGQQRDQPDLRPRHRPREQAEAAAAVRHA